MEWIPIKEKEPLKGKLLLFCGIFGGVFLGKYSGELLTAYGKQHMANEQGRNSGHRQILAWMSVPEPYVDLEAQRQYQEIVNEYHFRCKKRKRYDSRDL